MTTTKSNGARGSSEWQIEDLDLDAYMKRIGYDGDKAPTVETLFALHRAHADSIPFENLNVTLRRGISLEMDVLQDKLIRQRRGGYCFEHNLLLGAVLERLGYRVQRLAARVQAGGSGSRTHMLLVVGVGGVEWLADVGFGATLLEPMRLEEDTVSRQGGWTYGLARQDDGSWWLRSRDADGWTDLYSFTREPQLLIDFAVYNHYTSTHPDSPFVKGPRAVRVKPEVRYTLGERTFIAKAADGSSKKNDLSEDEAVETLRNTFGIVLEHGDEARLRAALRAEG